MKNLSLFVFLTFASALTACSKQSHLEHRPVVSALETACTGGVDNDFDGLVDCADPDCSAEVACPDQIACTQAFYQVTLAINSAFSAIDPSTNPWTLDAVSNDVGFVVNSAGYNINDAYVYALSGANLIRIDRDGDGTNLGAVTGDNFLGVTNVGDFDGEGFLWVKWFADTKAYKINIATLTATEVETAVTGDDWVYRAETNAFYSVDALNNVVIFDLDTNTASTVAITGALELGAHGADWFDADGNLYAFASATGHVRLINPETGAAVFVGSLPGSAGSDGAACSLTLPAFEICDNNVDDDGDGSTDEVGDGLDPDDNHCVTFRDTDGDGVFDAFDLDDDNDGIPDTFEVGDTDQDGVPDRLDLDSDADGITDSVEAGHRGTDANGDGRVDGPYGSNGLADSVETSADSASLDYDQDGTGGDRPRNSDGGGKPDFQDADSDNDGVADVVEGFDNAGDGTPDVVPSGDDTDGDGLDDAFDTDDGGTASTLPNSDNDNIPNYRDADDDNDGVATADELGDEDDNGVPDYLEGTPVDGDGGLADGGDDDAGTDGGSVIRPGGGLAGGALCAATTQTQGGDARLAWLLLGAVAVLGYRRRVRA